MNGYRSFSVTVPGGSHAKHNIPCQDASFHDDKDYVSIAVVADGHGDSNCLRSDRGSKLAVECAQKEIQNFVSQYKANQYQKVFKLESGNTEEILINDRSCSLAEFKKLLHEKLIVPMVNSWNNKVWEDYEKDPFTQDELAKASEKYRERYSKDTEAYQDGKYIPGAYGTTLIAAAITPHYWFGFHIGDGRFTVLYPDGKGDQPVPWDPQCYLNVTTSVCDDDILTRAFGVRSFLSFDKDKFPIAVFLCSDGVDDNYPVDENENKIQLCRIYRTISIAFAEKDYDYTCGQMKILANRFATEGKGDDTSIAGFINMEEMRKVAPEWKEKIEKAEGERAAEKTKTAETPVDAETLEKAKEETVKVKEASARVTEAAGKITEAVKTAAAAKSRAERALETVKSARDRETYKKAIEDVKAAVEETDAARKTADENLVLAKQAAAEATAAAVIKDTNKDRAKNNEPYIEQAGKDIITIAAYAASVIKTCNEAQNVVPAAEKAKVQKAIDEATDAATKAAAAADAAKKARDSAESALAKVKGASIITEDENKTVIKANDDAKESKENAARASEYIESAQKAIKDAESAAVSKIAIKKVNEAKEEVNKAAEDTETANNDAKAAEEAVKNAFKIVMDKRAAGGGTKPVNPEDLDAQGVFIKIDPSNNILENPSAKPLAAEQQRPVPGDSSVEETAVTDNDFIRPLP